MKLMILTIGLEADEATSWRFLFDIAGLDYLKFSSVSNVIKILGAFEVSSCFVLRFIKKVTIMVHVTVGSLAAAETFAAAKAMYFGLT